MSLSLRGEKGRAGEKRFSPLRLDPLPGVERTQVHERTCTLTVLYHGEEKPLRAALAGFSFAEAARTAAPQDRQRASSG